MKNFISKNNTSVAIQGIKASFHEEAARLFFGGNGESGNYFGDGGNIEVVPSRTFSNLFSAVKESRADYGICAFENSLAGSILPNYALLRNTDLEIFGEVYLCIEMQLMALPGQRIEDIQEIHSHPMALLQCRGYLDGLGDVQLVESTDTASSAMEIREGNIHNRAAIAGRRAAEEYGLEIIASDIHDNKRNFTRFLTIGRKGQHPVAENIDKASISFRASHAPGSLAKILTIIGDHGINMNKIQSLPVIGEEWRYYFYVDLRFEDYDNYRKMLETIGPLTDDLMVLGEYAQASRPV